jgi:NAD+--asparagine ADP-ribosyltransferase
MTHEFIQGEQAPRMDRRADDVKLIELNHRIDKLADKVTSLHENHTEHKKELSDLSQAVSKLSNTINRAIWILIGGAAVIAFLASGQFTQTVNTGSAIVGSQNGGR